MKNTEENKIINFLNIPFDQRYSVSKLGVKWSAKENAWLYLGTLPNELKKYESVKYSFERLIQDRRNKIKKVPLKPNLNFKLRPHQQEAVDLITQCERIKRVGFLLADDVGLGKSASALQSAINSPLSKVLIVCPLAVCAHWRQTIEYLGDRGKDIVVINYDRLQKLFLLPTDTKVKKLKSKARVGTPMVFDYIIFDECHKLKNPESARAKFAFKLAQKAKFILWLSATAGTNPLELSPLASLLAQMTGSKLSEMKDFEKWCENMDLGVSRESFGKWAWNGGEVEAKRVHKLIFEGKIPAGLRRRPEDLANWPSLERIIFPQELSSEAQTQYDAAWREFRSALGLSLKGQRNPKASLAASLRFRQKSSLLRVQATAEQAIDLKENGKAVAISVAFRETKEALIEILQKHGKVSFIDGTLSAPDKEANRIEFQQDKADFCIFTVEEGISLHELENKKPRALLIHDLRWSGISLLQIEGRTHRDGKFCPAFWCYAPDTIEEKIIESLLRKITTLKNMIGDKTDLLTELEEEFLNYGS